MEIINMDIWPRRKVFDFFSGISQPFYSLSFNLDVTRLHDWVKEQGLSFYYALCWLVTSAVNSVPAFMISIDGGKVVRLDRREPSFTDMKKGSEQFHIVTLPAGEDMREFCRRAAKLSWEQEVFIDMESESSSLIFISCLPWLELTACTNERDFDPDDAVPRINWGKYVQRDGRFTLNMSVEVNHRLIDGLHVGQFAAELERLIAGL